MATAGFRAQVMVAGAPVPFADAPTTADATLTRFRVSDPDRSVWDRSAAFTVRRSGDAGATFTAVPAGEYTLDRLSGTVVFAAAQPAGTVVQVSGSYLTLSAAAEAKEYSYTLTGNNAEATRFGDGYARRAQTQKEVTGSLSQWATADRYFEDALASGQPVVLAFYSDAGAAPDLRVWALVASSEISAAVDGLVETSVEWEGTPDADGRAVSLG